MLIYVVILALLVVLLLRPSWGMLAFFTAVAASAWLRFGLRAFPEWNLPFALLVGAVQVACFAGAGALIVWLRGAKLEARTPSEQEIDNELARIRTEATARDSQQQPPQA